MRNIKNILKMIYNWLFSIKVVTEIEDHPIDVNLVNENDQIISDEIFSLINHYRKNYGLSIFEKGDVYSVAYSIDHIKYMMDQKKISHDNYGIRSSGLLYRGAIRVGEIIAYGQSGSQSVVNAWLKSPSHKKVIDGNFTHVGFATLKDFRGTYYFMGLFYHE